MDTSNITTERAQRVGEKWNDKERAIVIQFSFCKIKINFSETARSLREVKFPYLKIFAKRKFVPSV